MTNNKQKSEEYWQKKLSREQYRIIRLKGTERAFTGEFWNNKEKGTYYCAACGTKLFHSDTKYDSGCGWPSFFKSIKNDVIEEKLDLSHGRTRTEVLCKACGGHLGHVFKDGPEPTGLRYCINSESLKFRN